MTDRELLEQAAKAAGIKHSPSITAACRGERTWWNPLIDDGDALRLAVKLGLRVGSDGQSLNPLVRCWRAHYEKPDIYEPQGTDPYAATRRAIVRAAAEIGRSME